jgi:hypothetical protein
MHATPCEGRTRGELPPCVSTWRIPPAGRREEGGEALPAAAHTTVGLPDSGATPSSPWDGGPRCPPAHSAGGRRTRVRECAGGRRTRVSQCGRMFYKHHSRLQHRGPPVGRGGARPADVRHLPSRPFLPRACREGTACSGLTGAARGGPAVDGGVGKGASASQRRSRVWPPCVVEDVRTGKHTDMSGPTLDTHTLGVDHTESVCVQTSPRLLSLPSLIPTPLLPSLLLHQCRACGRTCRRRDRRRAAMSTPAVAPLSGSPTVVWAAAGRASPPSLLPPPHRWYPPR